MAAHRVELCKLFDGTVSLRLDGEEIVILPGKNACDVETLSGAFCAMAEKLHEQYSEDVEEAYERVASRASDQW